MNDELCSRAFCHHPKWMHGNNELDLDDCQAPEGCSCQLFATRDEDDEYESPTPQEASDGT
jgi:hypothetical protein